MLSRLATHAWSTQDLLGEALGLEPPVVAPDNMRPGDAIRQAMSTIQDLQLALGEVQRRLQDAEALLQQVVPRR